MDLEQSLSDFSCFLRKRGSTDNTITAYVSGIRQYYGLYKELSLERLIRYRAYLLSHYKASTVNLRIYGMNAYLQYLSPCLSLLDEDLEGYRMTSVKYQQKPFADNVISQTDYEAFRDGLKKDQEMFWYFVIRFMASTGCRVSELIQIKMEHLQLGYMDLYSKGGKIRRIFFPDILCEEAIFWFLSQGIESGFIFLNHAGNQITPRGISGQLKKLAPRYGVDPDTVYPHSFRHRFAKNFLERFNDISLLADLMGHESIETTRIYLKKSSQEQRQVIDEVVVW